MRKGRKTKNGAERPDDYFAVGPFEYARFGRFVVGRTRGTPEQWQAARSKLAATLPEMIAEIDELVSEIAKLVTRLPPERLLHRAWWEFAFVMSLAGYGSSESGQLDCRRMIDYVQSVIASVKPISPSSEEVNESDWGALTEKVGTLFRLLNGEYQMCLAAHLQRTNPVLDWPFDEFRYRAELMWMNVRGQRYSLHERQALLDVLEPHSDILLNLFGITAQDLVVELEKIQSKLTRGPADLFSELDHQAEAFERLGVPSEESSTRELKSLDDMLSEDPELAAQAQRLARQFGSIIFFIELITQLPTSLLDELAWSPGEEKSFFEPGSFCGWPQRIWPTMKRPFIRLGGRVLCFDLSALFDNFYRVLQRTVVHRAPEYKQIWNNRQKAVSETAPLHLPHSLATQVKGFSVRLLSVEGCGWSLAMV